MGDQHSHLPEFDNHISKPRPLRVPSIQAPAVTRFEHYKLPNQQDDLDRIILAYTKSIFLPHDRSLNIVQTFWILAVSLSIRIDSLKQPEDVKHCVMFFRYLQDQPHGFASDVAIALLLDALSFKVELELGDVREDIEEIADLCHRLLNSDVSTRSQEAVGLAVVRVFRARFGKGSRWEEQKIIQSLREANIRRPHLHLASNMIAEYLLERFEGTHSIDHSDYKEGTAILDEVIAFRARDTPSPYQKNAVWTATLFAMHRLRLSGKPEHLEEAIYRSRNLLNAISPDHPLHPFATHLNSMLQNMRGIDQLDFVSFGGFRIVHSSNFEPPSHPSFRDLTASLAQSNVDPFSSVDHLNALFSAKNSSFTDVSEIEDAAKYCRQLLASPFAQAGRSRKITGHALGVALIRAFGSTNKIEYLDEAISVIRDILGRDPWYIYTLIIYLTIRFNLLHHRKDLNELMQLYPIAVNDISGSIPQRFEHSCRWAHLSRTSWHPSTPTAYEKAISLMQTTLTSSPTLHSQHLLLVAMRDHYEELPLDYASYLVDKGQLEKAIEILERGRALMWSEMRGFRTSIDKIRLVDSYLADKFTTVNRELEMLALTVPLSNDFDDKHGGINRMGQYGDFVVRQQGLLDDREKIISRIQALTDFKDFLTPPSFDTLRSAALRGPVIMIGHSEWRSDIIILLHDSPPSLIPTGDGFYGRVNNLRDQLLDARKESLESSDYENALNSVLKELYELVGRPVIQRLNELHIPEQSRVWWCPTSSLCSLPLHAMGPIPSDVGRPKYFLDLYIPSYTPTLSALIESNKCGTVTLGKPSILLALQPDKFMTQALDEMRVVQAAETHVTTLIATRATPSAVLERLRDHRFAHIVCHGILETGKPFEASFKLYKDARLSLLDIVRSQLPDAEFAFLSACHTAELTEESVADEGLHLAAAMQYCGFRSVVGTMWAMADTDGRDLAKDFYKSVFSDSDSGQGVRHYERTAEALRDAVQRLRRRKGITSERWVNFVHYGA